MIRTYQHSSEKFPSAKIHRNRNGYDLFYETSNFRLILSPTQTLIPYFKIFCTLSILRYNLFSNSANPWIPTIRAKKYPASKFYLLAEIDRNCNGDTICLRKMDDVKLRPVGTLACCCSAHARRPKRIFIGSHRDRLHAILAHAKRNFTPVTKWKLCASVFCINDSPPLDASPYFRFGPETSEPTGTTGDEFPFSNCFFRFFFLQSFFNGEERTSGGSRNIGKYGK